MIDALRRMPVLRELPLDALERMASRSALRELAAGDRLVREGEAGDAVFALLEGRVAIEVALGSAERGVIATRGPGDLVGEMALLDDAPRSASARAEDRVRALRIPGGVFLEAMGQHSPAALALVRSLSRRLRESDAAQIERLRARAAALESSNRLLSRENRRLRGELDARFGFEDFAGSSRLAEDVRAAARRAAESELPVILTGESGTGRELLARAVHAASERRARPFEVLRCALFAEPLLESELFGHARGAFAGAHAAKPGLLERADGGTLLIRELSEMPRATQAALLRFVELGEYRRLGDTSLRRADVRVIAALPLGVEETLAGERVRRDLLLRLDVFRVAIPPLRARREDVAEIAARLAEAEGRRRGGAPLRFEPAALAALAEHDFPGNVRELRAEIERLHGLLGAGARVPASALSLRMRGGAPSGRGYGDALRSFKAHLVRDALERSGGSRSAAARELGVHPSNLMRMIRELGLAPTRPGRRRAR
jgi:transcriptional regulator with PAS, ATPase and Fis domain